MTSRTSARTTAAPKADPFADRSATMPIDVSNRRGFDKWLKHYQPRLLAYANRKCGQDGEDALSEAWRIAWQTRDRAPLYPTPSEFLGRIAKILNNVCSNMRRKQARRQEILYPNGQMKRIQDEYLPRLDSEYWYHVRHEITTYLERVSLTGTQEYCIRLWLDGHSQRAIAEHLHISQQGVAGHIAAAVDRLRSADGIELSLEALKLFRDASRPRGSENPNDVWDPNEAERYGRAF